MAAQRKATFAVIGMGGMGSLIVPRAMEDGHTFLGAVDVGEKVGRPLSEFVEHPATPDTTVQASIEDLIAAAGAPDVVFVSANVPLAEEAVIAEGLLRQGINVLTLEPTLFEGLGEVADRLDAAGKAGGATVLAGGIQDPWWIHLPAVAAGSNSNITRVSLDDAADISYFNRTEGEYEAGAGMSQQDWDAWKDKQLSAPPVQGGPLRELARLLGFTPGDMTHEILPITAKTPMDWPGAETVLQPGEIIGARFEVAFPTEGPQFTGSLEFVLLEGGPAASENSVTISGTAELTMRFPVYDAMTYVPLGIVRRIIDVIEAPAGLVRVRELKPAQYVHPPA